MVACPIGMRSIPHSLEAMTQAVDGKSDEEQGLLHERDSTLSEMASHLFALFDREQRGYVVASDIDSSLGDEMGLTYSQLHDIFDILDQGKTGKITLEDFTSAFVSQAFLECNKVEPDTSEPDEDISNHGEPRGEVLESPPHEDINSAECKQSITLSTDLQENTATEDRLPRFILDSVDYEDDGTGEGFIEQQPVLFQELWRKLSEDEDESWHLPSRSPPDGVETHLFECDFSDGKSFTIDDNYRMHPVCEKNESFCLSELQMTAESPVPAHEQDQKFARSLENPDSSGCFDNNATSALQDEQEDVFPPLNTPCNLRHRPHLGSRGSEERRRHSRRDLRRLHSTPLATRRPKRRSIFRGNTIDSTSNHLNSTLPACTNCQQVRNSIDQQDMSVNNNFWNSVNGEATFLDGDGEHNRSMSTNSTCCSNDVERLSPEEKEDWNAVLTRLKCTSLFAGNRNLRFVWQQINSYQPDLLHTFEEFLKNSVDEIQGTYAKFQELEISLSNKTEQHDRELASIYDEMEQMLTREKEILQSKFSEREEKSRLEYNRLIDRKEAERQEVVRQKTELEDRMRSVFDELGDSKSTADQLSRQLNQALGGELHLRQENEFLRQENCELQVRLRDSKRTMLDIQDQCTSVRSILDTDKENYRRCLRRYQDVLEEKEFLDMNITNMSNELTELKSLNKSLQDRMDSGLNTSMLWSEEQEDTPPSTPSSPIPDDDIQPEALSSPSSPSYVREMSLKEELLTDLDPLSLCQPSNVSKVVFVGDANVGKTSIIRKICRGTFQEQRNSTTVPDYVTKAVPVGDRVVALQLWDTVGQERFNSLPPAYFRKSDVVVLMYDIVNELTFINAKKWIKTIYDYTNEDVLLVLVGNKLDLDHRRQVKISRAEKLSKEHDAIFVETSAKSGENVAKFCQLIASTMLEKEDTLLIREKSVDVLDFGLPKKRTNERCCAG